MLSITIKLHGFLIVLPMLPWLARSPRSPRPLQLQVGSQNFRLLKQINSSGIYTCVSDTTLST